MKIICINCFHQKLSSQFFLCFSSTKFIFLLLAILLSVLLSKWFFCCCCFIYLKRRSKKNANNEIFLARRKSNVVYKGRKYLFPKIEFVNVKVEKIGEQFYPMAVFAITQMEFTFFVVQSPIFFFFLLNSIWFVCVAFCFFIQEGG